MFSFPAEGITYWNYPVIPFVSSCHWLWQCMFSNCPSSVGKRAPSRCYMTKYVTVLLDSYSKVVLNFSNLAASSHLFAHANNCSKVEKKTDQIFIPPPSPHFRLWSTYSEQMIRRLCKLKLYSIPGTRRILRSCILSIQPTSSESWWPYSNLSLGTYAVCVICMICTLCVWYVWYATFPLLDAQLS